MQITFYNLYKIYLTVQMSLIALSIWCYFSGVHLMYAIAKRTPEMNEARTFQQNWNARRPNRRSARAPHNESFRFLCCRHESQRASLSAHATQMTHIKLKTNEWLARCERKLNRLA